MLVVRLFKFSLSDNKDVIFVRKPKLYIPSTLNIDLIIDCVCSKMLNHGLNHEFFVSLFKLIPCPIH